MLTESMFHEEIEAKIQYFMNEGEKKTKCSLPFQMKTVLAINLYE